MGDFPKESFDRFMAKVEKTDDCWLWQAYKKDSGYGVFRDGSKLVRAHRYSYQILVGEIPFGRELDHLCKNKSCVNPSHLEPVTHRTNVLRGESPLAKQARQTYCKRGHELNKKNTYNQKNRNCIICARIRAKKQTERIKLGIS